MKKILLTVTVNGNEIAFVEDLTNYYILLNFNTLVASTASKNCLYAEFWEGFLPDGVVSFCIALGFPLSPQ